MGVAPILRSSARPAVHRMREEVRGVKLRREIQSADKSVPTLAIFEALVRIWSNPNFSAGADYLMQVASEARKATLPILECGSGLSTIVASHWSDQPVHALEHIPAWARKVRRAASRSGLSPLVHDAPLRDCGGYEWYRLPVSLPARFGLVICDGPPHRTVGGRFGMVPEMGDRISGSRVLLDDADRKGERAAVERWAGEFGADVVRHGSDALLVFP